MKSLIFDSGPIISLSMNNLLWVLKELKKSYDGKFYITMNVKKEIIDNPLNSKKFKFEALQVMKQQEDGVIELFNKLSIKQKVDELLDIANNLYFAHGKNINIVQFAEMEVLSAAIMTGADAIVVDERTTRLLVENTEKLRKILQRKLHTDIKIDRNRLIKLRNLVKNIRVIRSVELVLIAYEKGLLDKYIPNIDNPKKNLLDGLLWALKLNGCSISDVEINKIISLKI